MGENGNNGKGKFPPWIRVRASCGSNRTEVGEILRNLKLNTVCAGARCPNLNECWHRRTATFMIMGNTCTRNCRFCAVDHTQPLEPLDPEEPVRLAEASARLELKYVVVTSVTRDDLPDGGAGHFAAVIRALRSRLPSVGIEVLTPDFNAVRDDLATVVAARPDVFNHNVETVERLSRQIRCKADYRRSLTVLRLASELEDGQVPVKSGIMVGLGETDAEVEQTIRDLYEVIARIITIGQYLPPTSNHWPLDRYVEPEKFEAWGRLARDIGFDFVASAPMVRSSYNAGELVGRG